MRKVTHEVLVNVESSSYSINPPVEVYQNDPNTHILLIKLKNSAGNPISIDGNSRPRISFQKDGDTVVSSYVVDIVNPYRGVLSYTIGPALVQNPGRYTVYLDVNGCGCSCNCGPTISFVITIIKKNSYNPSDQETTVPQSFVDEVTYHMSDSNVHLDEDGKEFVDTFKYSIAKLERLLDADLEGLISEMVLDEASKVLKKAFITVDFMSDRDKLTRDEVCDGKIVRVNYPTIDANSSTAESEEEIVNPAYFYCRLLGDTEVIEWFPLDVTSGSQGEIPEEIQEELRDLQSQINGLNQKIIDLRQDFEDHINNTYVSLEGRVKALEDKTEVLESDLDKAEERIDTLEDTVEQMDARVEKAEKDAADAKSQVESLKEIVEDLQEEVVAARGGEESLDARLDSIEEGLTTWGDPLPEPGDDGFSDIGSI